jgi:hypothetical protein
MSRLKRESELTRTENFKRINANLDKTRRNLGVNGILVTLGNNTANRNNGFTGHTVKQRIVRKNDLSYAVMVAKVNENNAAVVTNSINPARKSYALAYMLGRKLVTIVSS